MLLRLKGRHYRPDLTQSSGRQSEFFVRLYEQQQVQRHNFQCIRQQFQGLNLGLKHLSSAL